MSYRYQTHTQVTLYRNETQTLPDETLNSSKFKHFTCQLLTFKIKMTAPSYRKLNHSMKRVIMGSDIYTLPGWKMLQWHALYIKYMDQTEWRMGHSCLKAGILPAPSAIRANVSAEGRRERHTLGTLLHSDLRKCQYTIVHYEHGIIKAEWEKRGRFGASFIKCW